MSAAPPIPEIDPTDGGDLLDERIRPFATVDLAALAKQGVPSPELLCDQMLYRGALHSLAGPPDGGKSTLLGYWTVTQLAAGNAVVLLDEEAGREATVEKLLALGVEPPYLEQLAYVEFPSRRWDEADRRGLELLLDEHKPTLIGYDSSAALLSVAGRDEDRAGDVTPFYKLLLELSRTYHAAGVVLDHIPKSQQGGRYARGSGAKLATVDVAYLIDVVKPFTRQRPGLLTLTASKDRRGYLHREYEVRVEVEDGQLALNFSKAAAGDDDGLSPAARKLLAVLPEASDPLSAKQLVDRLADRFGHGLKRTTVSEALNVLASRGVADGAGDPGKEKRWWKT